MTTTSLPGRFGAYGGRFVPETLVPALDELEHAWRTVAQQPAFKRELDELLANYAGRPTPLTRARNLPGAQEVTMLLKREDLLHTGAHKLNNALGQALLAKAMGKRRIIAETGAGQHGVATATACALLGLPCVVYMGAVDVERQRPNVLRMRLLGAEVVPVKAGSQTLKDALNEALRDWVTNVRDTHYVLGSAAGPHPFPTIVRSLQSVIGTEAEAQCLEAVGRLPGRRRGLRGRRQQRHRPVLGLHRRAEGAAVGGGGSGPRARLRGSRGVAGTGTAWASSTAR